MMTKGDQVNAMKLLVLVAVATGLGWFVWHEYPALMRYLNASRM